jgi:signal transduction histidine kinase
VGVAIEALQNFGALEDPNKTKEYLNIAQQEINRLSILVEKVLNTSLFERPDFPIKKEEINMQELILSVLNSMKLQFQNKKALVDFTSHGDNFQISGDRTHVTSVIYNLVENALKYSPINPKIKINLQTKEQELHLSIIDNGLGIPKEFHDKIFEKFFRTPTGNTHNIKGQGLGLSYVKKVIEKHSGNIRVESNINKGSHFLISFPI